MVTIPSIQEGIDCEFEMLPVSPGAMVNLIDLPPQQNIVSTPK